MKSISSNYSTVKAFKLVFKVYTFPLKAHYKQKISKINFTAFQTELEIKFLGLMRLMMIFLLDILLAS